MSLTPKLDIARKFFDGQERGQIYGINPALGTTWEDISLISANISWPVEASGISVQSSHAADTAAGLGLQSVSVSGLGAGGVRQSEVIPTSGETPALSTLQYLRVVEVESEDVGTYGGSHQGDITIAASGIGGPILSLMKGNDGASGSDVFYGRGVAGNGFACVPAGKVMYITGGRTISQTGQEVSYSLRSRGRITTATGGTYGPIKELWSALEVKAAQVFDFDTPIQVAALSDVWFRALAPANAPTVSVHLYFYLMDADAAGN